MWTNLRCLRPVSYYLHSHFVCLSTCRLGLNLASYIPRTFAPALGYISSFISTTLGRDPSSTEATDVSLLRQSLSDAETGLREAEERLKNAQQELEDLFKPERFGKDGEWKKLEKLCLEKETGGYVLPTTSDVQLFTSPRYTYEVCLFGEARQKASSGGSVQSLGRFSSWKRDEEVGTPDYYSRQVFTGGAKCWNGPERSVQVCSLDLTHWQTRSSFWQVDLSCGLDNELLTVAEPEKCEYLIIGTTPALCTSLDVEGNVKDEL